jgi:hypothetical protein
MGLASLSVSRGSAPLAVIAYVTSELLSSLWGNCWHAINVIAHTKDNKSVTVLEIMVIGCAALPLVRANVPAKYNTPEERAALIAVRVYAIART